MKYFTNSKGCFESETPTETQAAYESNSRTVPAAGGNFQS